MATVRSAVLDVGVAAGMDETSLAEALDAAFPHIKGLIVTIGAFSEITQPICACIFISPYQAISRSNMRCLSAR